MGVVAVGDWGLFGKREMKKNRLHVEERDKDGWKTHES